MSHWIEETFLLAELPVSAEDVERPDYALASFAKIKFAPVEKPPYCIHPISTLGPAVKLSGGGKFCDMPLTSESREDLNRGVVITELRGDGSTTRTIRIGGELVHKQDFSWCPMVGGDDYWQFEGRTEQEKWLFEPLISRLNEKIAARDRRIACMYGVGWNALHRRQMHEGSVGLIYEAEGHVALLKRLRRYAGWIEAAEARRSLT